MTNVAVATKSPPRRKVKNLKPKITVKQVAINKNAIAIKRLQAAIAATGLDAQQLASQAGLENPSLVKRICSGELPERKEMLPLLWILGRSWESLFAT